MSNSQNKKNEQQNNLCTTLTEQWNKGELPYGYYYIKTISGGEVIDRYYRDCTDYDLCEYGDVWENRFEDEIIEVLAPVPSYDHFVELTEMAKENQHLKELLLECRNLLNCSKEWAYTEVCESLITKIDNAIGEKK